MGLGPGGLQNRRRGESGHPAATAYRLAEGGWKAGDA